MRENSNRGCQSQIYSRQAYEADETLFSLFKMFTPSHSNIIILRIGYDFKKWRLKMCWDCVVICYVSGYIFYFSIAFSALDICIFLLRFIFVNRLQHQDFFKQSVPMYFAVLTSSSMGFSSLDILVFLSYIMYTHKLSYCDSPLCQYFSDFVKTHIHLFLASSNYQRRRKVDTR